MSYLDENYSASKYIEFSVIAEIIDVFIDLRDDFHYDEENKKILNCLGIKKVLVGSRYTSVNSWKCIQKNRAMAVRKIKNEISKYLSRHKNRFEKDKDRGVLEKYVLGTQLELPFGDFLIRPALNDKDAYGFINFAKMYAGKKKFTKSF